MQAQRELVAVSPPPPKKGSRSVLLLPSAFVSPFQGEAFPHVRPHTWCISVGL